jgi:hypothetical protein
MAENTIERWLPVQGYPCYMVSDQGRVKSYRSADNPKILKPAANTSGYESVTLTSGDRYGAPGSKKRTIVIHKLVAQAFVPNPDPEKKKFVDHINTIRTDSRACNLRWVTALENYHNPLTLQHMADARPAAIEKTKHKVYVYDENLNLIATYPSTAEAARLLKKNQGNIASCCTGALPRYGGYIWSYTELHDISEREELEKEKEYQFKKNRKSTLKAVSKYQKAQYAAGKGWHHKHLEESRAKSRKYYHEHREEMLRKAKAKRDEEKRRREESGK